MEQGFAIVRTLVTEGPAAAWRQIVEGLTNLRDMVIEQVMTYVRSQIVQIAITRLLASLNPAGAFIQAILAIYNTIMFLVERLRQIAQVAASLVDAIAAIAAGVVAPAAARVERTLAGLLPLVISFLARLIGLGNVGQVVTRFLDRVRAPIMRGIDRVVAWIVAQARRMGSFLASGARRGLAAIRNWWSSRKVIRARDGASHSLYFEGERAAARLTLASVPTPVDRWLVSIAPAARATSGPSISAHTAATALVSGGLRRKLTSLNAAGSAAPTPQEVDALNADLEILAGHLAVLIPLDQRSAASAAAPAAGATSVALPAAVAPGKLIKLVRQNQIARIDRIAMSQAVPPGQSTASPQAYQLINYSILRPRSPSQPASAGLYSVAFMRDWGSAYREYVDDPRELYLGPTPRKGDATGAAVKTRMAAQGRYDPATRTVLYGRNLQGQPLAAGTAPNRVSEDNCDMGHLVDAVTWWNSNGRLTFPQSPTVLAFMTAERNYELEPSGPNQLRGAQLAARGIRYLPPVG